MWLSVKRLLCLLPLLLLPLAPQAATYTEGKEYASISPPQPTNDPTRIEVVEMFWYGCPHCFHLEPKVEEWLSTKPDDVEFIRMPAVFNVKWELLARAWYTAELLNVTDKIHKALFNAIHEERKRMTTADAVRDFFVEQGVSADDFASTYNSFGVAAKVNRAKQMSQRYGINGVPALIINGKYRTSATQAGNEEVMFEVVNYLIDQERQAAK